MGCSLIFVLSCKDVLMCLLCGSEAGSTLKEET